MQQNTSFSPIMALVLYFALYAVVLVVAAPMVRAWAAPHFDLGSVRGMTAFRGVSSIVFGWLNLAFAILILRLRGQTLADIGWGQPGAIWGWIAAIAIVGLMLWFSFSSFDPARPRVGPLDARTWLSDWSFFRISLMIGIGLTAGICEETIFRGFVMTQARDAGAPVLLQIVLSGLLFGLAHLGIAMMSGQFNMAAAVGVVTSTTVFGMLFAIVYLLAGRVLTPGIVGHGIFAAVTEPWMIMAVIGMGMRQ
jgi:membrane protease YdiL (CAAX protease family)